MAAAAITAGNPFMRANATASASDASGNAGSTASSISSNDFLTLLVTEMKNQDPTAQTDPNEYVNQLVQVNSLEQLIEINQNVSSALVSPGSGGTGPVSGKAVIASGAQGTSKALSAQTCAEIPMSNASSAKEAGSYRTSLPAAPGNLSVPRAIPAAHRIAQGLSGRN